MKPRPGTSLAKLLFASRLTLFLSVISLIAHAAALIGAMVIIFRSSPPSSAQETLLQMQVPAFFSSASSFSYPAIGILLAHWSAEFVRRRLKEEPELAQPS